MKASSAGIRWQGLSIGRATTYTRQQTNSILGRYLSQAESMPAG